MGFTTLFDEQSDLLKLLLKSFEVNDLSTDLILSFSLKESLYMHSSFSVLYFRLSLLFFLIYGTAKD